MSFTIPPSSSTGRQLRRVGDWLDASPSELVGLALLLAGSLVVAGLLLLGGQPGRAGPSPAPLPTGAVPTGAAKVLVHVTGAVARPGLVELSEGARVADAIDAAGGLSIGAVATSLNLARHVADGEQILVPTAGGAEEPVPGGTAASSAFAPDGTLDLNRATAEELEELPGIGPVLAQRIVAWRDEHGPFTDPGQLREVPGIGERTFQSLVDLVRV